MTTHEGEPPQAQDHGPLVSRIEGELAAVAGVYAAVEVEGDLVRLNGSVESEEQRLAAEDIVARVAPSMRIDNALEVQSELPQSVDDVYAAEPSSGLTVGTMTGASLDPTDLSPSFQDQTLLSDPVAAPGPSDGYEDPVQEGDNPYTPPADPVVTTNARGETQVLGGFSSTADETVEVERSSDGRLGDEAIADAVRRELQEDAATTELRLDVVVRRGVVHLRGEVEGLEDAENAEDVAGRVPGVREVQDETRVRSL